MVRVKNFSRVSFIFISANYRRDTAHVKSNSCQTRSSISWVTRSSISWVTVHRDSLRGFLYTCRDPGNIKQSIHIAPEEKKISIRVIIPFKPEQTESCRSVVRKRFLATCETFVGRIWFSDLVLLWTSRNVSHLFRYWWGPFCPVQTAFLFEHFYVMF